MHGAEKRSRPRSATAGEHQDLLPNHSVDAWTPLAQCNGAEKRSRTVDLLITNELLYQLSYFGVPFIC